MMFLVGPLDNYTAWPVQCILHVINNMTVMMFLVGPLGNCTAWPIKCILHGINNMIVMMFLLGPLNRYIAWSVHCTQNMKTSMMFSVGPHDHYTAWSVLGFPSSAVSTCCRLWWWRPGQHVHHSHSARTQHHLLCGQPVPPLPHCSQTALQQKGWAISNSHMYIK